MEIKKGVKTPFTLRKEGCILKKRVTIELTEEVYAKLKELAEKEKRKAKPMIEYLVENYVAKYGKIENKPVGENWEVKF